MLESLKYNDKGQAIIKDLYAWMDGGTVSVRLASYNSEEIQIDFTQKAFFTNKHEQFPPGSLILNNYIVGIRSDLERTILNTLKKATFSDEVSYADQLVKNCLEEAIQFVESEEYLKLHKGIER